MFRIWLPIAVIVALVGVGLIDFQALSPQLPERIATHFNLHGEPDGWMNRSQFVTTSLGTVFCVGWLICFMPVLMWLTPVASMKLPHRDYWLAPEREGLARRMMVERTLWFMAATAAMVVYMQHCTLTANIGNPGRLGCGSGLIAYLVFVAVWLGEMAWAFRRPVRGWSKLSAS